MLGRAVGHDEAPHSAAPSADGRNPSRRDVDEIEQLSMLGAMIAIKAA